MVNEAEAARKDERRKGEGWLRAGGALLTVLGALSLVAGLTWLLLNLHSPHPAVDLAVGAVLVAGGLVLLLPHHIELPPLATTIAAGVAALAGTAAGLAGSSARVCCMFAYVVERGWPYPWLRRGGVAEDPDTARRLAQADRWNVDVTSLVTSLLLWAYVGILIVAVAVLVRRALRARDGRRVEAG
jgi:hypothetical protein